jgi:LmbE family N-acetylglucosaminyl deacetylase
MPLRKTALALFAHPDDIEFVAAGTLLLLKEHAGFDIHYMNLATGSCGSTEMSADETRRVRLEESRDAAHILGATHHPPIADDLEILYTIPLLRKVAGIIRQVKPSIVLTHSPRDYMEDHMNTCRLAVTAAFTHGMPNFETDPPSTDIYNEDVFVYHAMPHGLVDPLRQSVTPDAFVDTTSVHQTKRQALAAHRSQKEWLDHSQGMESYLIALDEMSAQLGKMSGPFHHAEAWRRHLHLGFSAKDEEPRSQILSARSLPAKPAVLAVAPAAPHPPRAPEKKNGIEQTPQCPHGPQFVGKKKPQPKAP